LKQSRANSISLNNVENNEKPVFSNNKRVAIYVRVSKEDQHPENQVIELENYAQARGFNIYHIYIDQISGVRDSRPALNELMIDARNRKFDAVLIWKLDRLGRSLQHLIQIIEEFQKLNIDLICKDQPIDTTSASGKLIFHIFGAIAEFERELIRERIKLGLERARRQGKKLGRPRGSKDRQRRRRSGYYLRWQKQGKKTSPIKNNVLLRLENEQ